jgi:hypothetical protein
MGFSTGIKNLNYFGLSPMELIPEKYILEFLITLNPGILAPP